MSEFDWLQKHQNNPACIKNVSSECYTVKVGYNVLKNKKKKKKKREFQLITEEVKFLFCYIYIYIYIYIVPIKCHTNLDFVASYS